MNFTTEKKRLDQEKSVSRKTTTLTIKLPYIYIEMINAEAKLYGMSRGDLLACCFLQSCCSQPAAKTELTWEEIREHLKRTGGLP